MTHVGYYLRTYVLQANFHGSRKGGCIDCIQKQKHMAYSKKEIQNHRNIFFFAVPV